jgi:hypothetical protein
MRSLLERGFAVLARGPIGALGGGVLASLACVFGSYPRLTLGEDSSTMHFDLEWAVAGGLLGLLIGTCAGVLCRSVALPLAGTVFGALGMARDNVDSDISLWDALLWWAMLGAVAGALGGLLGRRRAKADEDEAVPDWQRGDQGGDLRQTWPRRLGPFWREVIRLLRTSRRHGHSHAPPQD